VRGGVARVGKRWHALGRFSCRGCMQTKGLCFGTRRFYLIRGSCCACECCLILWDTFWEDSKT
jgi:hypothetical protein